jgi:hypothetical protein
MNRTAEQTVREYFHALATGGDVARYYAEDATFWYPGELPMSGTWRGRAAIVDGFLGAAFQLLDPERDVAIEVTKVIAADPYVTVEWDSRATVRNGNPYHNQNIAIFHVRDGLITEAREYANTQHWEHALRDPQVAA